MHVAFHMSKLLGVWFFFWLVFFLFVFPCQGIKEVCHHSNKQKMDGGFNLSLKQDFETTGRKSQSFGEGPDDTSLVDWEMVNLGCGQLGLLVSNPGRGHHGKPGWGRGQYGLRLPWAWP